MQVVETGTPLASRTKPQSSCSNGRTRPGAGESLLRCCNLPPIALAVVTTDQVQVYPLTIGGCNLPAIALAVVTIQNRQIAPTFQLFAWMNTDTQSSGHQIKAAIRFLSARPSWSWINFGAANCFPEAMNLGEFVLAVQQNTLYFDLS